MACEQLNVRQQRRMHLIALGQMFVVTLLWSSSFPIHKVLLNAGMPPLTLAAYRYFLASLILAAALYRSRRKKDAQQEDVSSIRPYMKSLLVIGLCMYSAQGIHMTALSLITASDSGLVMMTWMPIAVLLLTLAVDRRFPHPLQAAGFGIVLIGLCSYFPLHLGSTRFLGIVLNVVSASCGAIAVFLTHRVFKRTSISALQLTTFTMLTGSFLLLIVALIFDHAYIPSAWQAAWLVYLALVNTAVGFALYNHTMRVLAPFELVVFQDSMIVQVGLLSAIFLGEVITSSMVFGMIVVVLGIVIVQVFAPRIYARGESEEVSSVLKR